MRSKKGIMICVVVMLFLLLVGLVWMLCRLESGEDAPETQPVANLIENTVPETTVETVPEATAQTEPETTQPQIDAPEQLIRLMELNPETEEFVLNYSQKKDMIFEYIVVCRIGGWPALVLVVGFLPEADVFPKCHTPTSMHWRCRSRKATHGSLACFNIFLCR